MSPRDEQRPIASVAQTGTAQFTHLVQAIIADAVGECPSFKLAGIVAEHVSTAFGPERSAQDRRLELSRSQVVELAQRVNDRFIKTGDDRAVPRSVAANWGRTVAIGSDAVSGGERRVALVEPSGEVSASQPLRPGLTVRGVQSVVTQVCVEAVLKPGSDVRAFTGLAMIEEGFPTKTAIAEGNTEIPLHVVAAAFDRMDLDDVSRAALIAPESSAEQTLG